ncbi:phosphoribosylglycinamide formyltransferase [Segetibacter sp. 3557_3]|nr:phosphoribosylglycinamide formyltransferase [Segetibacter sp. 3557_3]
MVSQNVSALHSSQAEAKVHFRLAVFASGAGSNAAKIIDHFRDHKTTRVAMVVSNKPGAGVIGIANANKVPVLLIDKEPFFRGNAYTDELKAFGIDFIVLAGFLWKVPAALIAAYPRKIINIHPALLPLYGGKGMYGEHVHTSVLAAGDKESGITIHYVDEHYDSGDIIFQARCKVEHTDTPGTLANKIHALEHLHYPVVIDKVVTQTFQLSH